MPSHSEKTAKHLFRTDEIRAKLREEVPVVMGEKDGLLLITQGTDLVSLSPKRLSATNKELLRDLLKRADQK